MLRKDCVVGALTIQLSLVVFILVKSLKAHCAFTREEVGSRSIVKSSIELKNALEPVIKVCLTLKIESTLISSQSERPLCKTYKSYRAVKKNLKFSNKYRAENIYKNLAFGDLNATVNIWYAFTL